MFSHSKLRCFPSLTCRPTARTTRPSSRSASPPRNVTVCPLNVTVYPRNATVCPLNVTVYLRNATVHPRNATVCPLTVAVHPLNVAVYPLNVAVYPLNTTSDAVNVAFSPGATLGPRRRRGAAGRGLKEKHGQGLARRGFFGITRGCNPRQTRVFSGITRGCNPRHRASLYTRAREGGEWTRVPSLVEILSSSSHPIFAYYLEVLYGGLYGRACIIRYFPSRAGPPRDLPLRQAQELEGRPGAAGLCTDFTVVKRYLVTFFNRKNKG